MRKKTIAYCVILLTCLVFALPNAKFILGGVINMDVSLGWFGPSGGFGLLSFEAVPYYSSSVAESNRCWIVFGNNHILSSFSYTVTRNLTLASIAGGISLGIAVFIILRKQRSRLLQLKTQCEQEIEESSPAPTGTVIQSVIESQHHE